MKVLVTGSSGFLGRWLVERLLARGDEVRALVRETSDTSVLPEGVEQMVGDVTAPETLGPAVKGTDVVFHLAGIRRAAQREVFMAVNTGGTRAVADAIAAMETPARLVFAGSLAATGPARDGRPVTEDDPFRPFEWYGESKAAAEKVLWDYREQLPWTIARPSRIMGPGDHENLSFFKIVAKGWRLQIGGPPTPISMVDVDDVVDGCLLLAEKDEAVGESFFLSSPSAPTLVELQDMVAESLGIETRPLPLPRSVLWSLAATADLVTKMTGKRLPLNRKLARQLTAPSWACSIEKAQTRLGYAPSRTMKDSVKRSADWYLEEGLIRPA